MKPEDAAIRLSLHLMQCGMMMPFEWVRRTERGASFSRLSGWRLMPCKKTKSFGKKTVSSRKNLSECGRRMKIFADT